MAVTLLRRQEQERPTHVAVDSSDLEYFAESWSTGQRLAHLHWLLEPEPGEDSRRWAARLMLGLRACGLSVCQGATASIEAPDFAYLAPLLDTVPVAGWEIERVSDLVVEASWPGPSEVSSQSLACLCGAGTSTLDELDRRGLSVVLLACDLSDVSGDFEVVSIGQVLASSEGSRRRPSVEDRLARLLLELGRGVHIDTAIDLAGVSKTWAYQMKRTLSWFDAAWSAVRMSVDEKRLADEEGPAIS